jgi:hypothetical protein
MMSRAEMRNGVELVADKDGRDDALDNNGPQQHSCLLCRIHLPEVTYYAFLGAIGLTKKPVPQQGFEFQLNFCGIFRFVCS